MDQGNKSGMFSPSGRIRNTKPIIALSAPSAPPSIPSSSSTIPIKRETLCENRFSFPKRAKLPFRLINRPPSASSRLIDWI